MRRCLLVVLLLVAMASPAGAEWQVKPFVGMKFGGSTNGTTNAENNAAGKRKSAMGASVAVIGDIFGVELDLGYMPGYFEGGTIPSTVLSSSLTTLTGNLVIALPRRLSEYTLRPYFVGGAGFLRRSAVGSTPGLLPSSRNLPTSDIGGGVTGFLTRNIGVSWDLRRFRTMRSPPELGTTIDGLKERISLWRANMALAIRY